MKGQVVQAYRYRGTDGDSYREREMREERWGSSIRVYLSLKMIQLGRLDTRARIHTMVESRQ